MEKLDLTHTHISGEILPAVTFLDGSMVLYSKMKNVFPSTQELALGSYPQESISMQQLYIQCIYVQHTLNNLNIQQ